MLEQNIIFDVEETSFNEKIIEASEKNLIIVDFWAPWCEPCKQLTPLLEKIITNSKGRVLLAKINIDENQQVAAQLRIQSIPTVFAFKNKQIVNAFQGVIPENKILEFIEKSLGEKLEEDFTKFYEKIKNDIDEKNFSVAKEELLEFIANKPKDAKAISLYLLILMDEENFEEASNFIDALDEETKNNTEIQSCIQKLKIKKKNIKGPNIEKLIKKLESNPNDIGTICEIADNYFAKNDYENAFNILLDNYFKNKNDVKNKILEFFKALGDSNETTVEYRKKFSKIMFS